MVDEFRESCSKLSKVLYGWQLGQRTIPCKWLMLLYFSLNHKGITSRKDVDGFQASCSCTGLTEKDVPTDTGDAVKQHGLLASRFAGFG